MSKKLLSVLLAVLMVVSSVSCLFTAATVTASAAGANLLVSTKAEDWTSGWNGEAGKDIDGEIMVKAAYRSVYTKVTLEPNTTYDFTFSFGQTRVGDVRVIPASEITDPSTELKTENSSGGIAAPNATNLATGTFTAELASGTPVDGIFYSASETFKTNSEKEFYIILDCYQPSANSKNNVVLKDLKLEEALTDPNVLNDEAIAGLTWNAIWNTGNRNPVTGVLDESESYSGEAYAMTFGSGSRWRDNYTVVTLEPNTTYDFSFYYKSSASGQEYVAGLGFVDASKLDFSTYKGDTVKAHLTDSTTTILGKDNATIGTDKTGNWNLAKTTFTTTDATEYVLYLNVTFAGSSFSALTLSDFNLSVQTNLFGGTKASDWLRGDTGAAFTNNGTDISGMAAYRSFYTKVTLKANTTYSFSFSAKYVKAQDVHLYPTSLIEDVTTMYSSSYWTNLSGDLATGSFVTDSNPSAAYSTDEEAQTYFNVSEVFTTGDETEYYLVIDGGRSSGAGQTVTTGSNSISMKDITLTILEKSSNLLDDTAMAGLTWNAIWNTGNRNPVTGVLDESDSYSGEAYAMTFGSNSRYRDNYINVTLEPNTTYNFSFYYKSSASGQEYVAGLGFVDASKVDLSTYKGDYVSKHLTDSSTTILGKANATIGTDKTGNWNLVKTTFTTTDATEYVLYLSVTFAGSSFSALTLSDFNLEAEKTTDDLTDTVASDWTSSWTGDTGSYEDVIAIKNAYHSAYTKVTLDAYNDYEFTFNAAWTKTTNVRVYSADEITDATSQLINSGSYVTGGTNNLVTSFTTTQPDADYSGSDMTEEILSTYYTVTASFRTLKAGEYYIIIDGGQFNSLGIHPLTYNTYTQIKNISLRGTPFEVDADNVLNDVIMPTLEWKALWGSSAAANNPVSAVLDESESYSGDSYVMQWGRTSRYRDNFTYVTLEPNTTYKFSFRYKAAGNEEIIHYVGFVDSSMVDFSTIASDKVEGHLTDDSAEILGKSNATVGQETNGVWNLVSTTFTTTSATEYIMYIGVGSYIDNSFSTITLSDFDLREWIDPNKLSQATVASGDVRWSVGADTEDDYITVDDEITYTNSSGESITRSRVYYYDDTSYSYYGGNSWRIILSNSTVTPNQAVFGYIDAKNLAANTTYSLSYVYANDYHVELADIYGTNGSIEFSDVTTKLLPTKDGTTTQSYLVTTVFTTTDAGDYTIKIQTARSDKYYYYASSSWAVKVSDLSLLEYEETEAPDIPDDANLLEDLSAFDWEYTWAKEGDAYTLAVEDNALNLTGIHYHGIYTALELAPNTEYLLTFDYISRGSIDRAGIIAAEKVNLANVNYHLTDGIVGGGGGLTYYQNIEKVDDGSVKNATVKFVTEDTNTYYLYIEGTSAAVSGLTGNTVISNMSLTKALDNSSMLMVDYDFEDGNLGVISTTSDSDKPEIVTEDSNSYLKFTRTNDGITVPFYHDSDTSYKISFDMKVLEYPTTETLSMSFRRVNGNNEIYGDISASTRANEVFSYRNDAYSLVTKASNGKLLTAPAGLNYGENSQFDGFKQTFTEGSDWVRYEITLDPDYTWYTGLACFGFDASEVGWSIALDNIKVVAIDPEFKADALEKFAPTGYAAIRQRTVDSKQGIRIKSSIDTSLLEGDIKVVEYGTLAINSSVLGDNELVYDMINSDFDAKVGVAYSAEDGKNAVFSEEGGIVTFTGVLTGLKDYSTDYTVRGYMIVESADGEQIVIYEDEGKALSVYDVVYAILNDGIENDDDTVANQIVSANETKYDNWVSENISEDDELTASETVSLTISNSASPVIDNYRGFSGTVYHAFGFMEDDDTGRAYDEAMRNKEIDRLADSGVHYVRTRYQSQWIFDDNTGYAWNSDRFNYFVKYCKELEKRDIEVILQVGWHFDFISQDGSYSICENDYFNGEGNDLYGESAGIDLSSYSDEDARIIKAARRYTYMMAKTLKYAKAKGVNNIKYFSYFVEPSNVYSDVVTAGHDKEQYLLFCQTMINALKNEYSVNDIKHMGPNEAGYSKLTEYILEEDPGLFDILTAHNYPQEGDIAENYDDYYEVITNGKSSGLSGIINGSLTGFADYKGFLETAKAANADAEFWADEFNIKDFENGEDGRGTSSFYRGLATAMGGIVAQQYGIQNIILWMSFDQLWNDRTGGDTSSATEFMNGIHQCGNAPSLFLSDDPYAQYYATSLFSKYNGYKNGTVYATNLTETAQKGVYVGAVKLEDGSWTISVLNMNSTAVEIDVAFDTAIEQTLYRHVVSADKADTYKNAELPEADKTFDTVGASFSDILPAGSFAVYTGVE